MNECAISKKGTLEARLDHLETLARGLNTNITLIYNFIPNANVPQKICDSGVEGEGCQDVTNGLEGRLEMLEEVLMKVDCRSKEIFEKLEDKFGEMTIE